MMVGHRALWWPGALALGATLGLAAAAMTALLLAAPDAGGSIGLDGYTAGVLRFTVMQAALSTLLSVAFALPVARALARQQRFPGRRLLIAMMGVPLVLPVIVAVFGIAAVWGRNGAISGGLQVLGFEPLSPLYGLSGILIAHVFFNMPLAVRLLLPVWDAIPGETWRLAAQLGMGSRAIFRLIEGPRLLAALPGIAILIFLLCFTSFVVVLALGGGPKGTTLEVAIFQALRLDFDIPRAVTLALVQVACCAVLAVVLLRFVRAVPSISSEGRTTPRPDASLGPARAFDTLAIATGALWVAAPLAAVLVAGLTGPVLEILARGEVWLALLRSVAVGLGGGVLALALGLGFLATTRDLAQRSGRLRLADALELGGSLTLVVSPVVLGAGLFVLLFPVIPVLDWALPLAGPVNGIILVPYVLRLVGPVLRRTAEHHDRLCAGLGLAGWTRLRLVEWPAARNAVATALGLVSAMATGDLTAIALFGTERDATLSLMLYRALGTYRIEEAAVLALLLVLTCLAVFLLIEGALRDRART